MTPRQLSPELSISSQILPTDIPAIAAAGFSTVICNRPDGEGGPSQPRFAEIAEAARKHGLEAVHIPISGGASAADVAAFESALTTRPLPALAFCRSGMRSRALWSAVQASRKAMGQGQVAGDSKAGGLLGLLGRWWRSEP